MPENQHAVNASKPIALQIVIMTMANQKVELKYYKTRFQRWRLVSKSWKAQGLISVHFPSATTLHLPIRFMEMAWETV